MAKMRSGERSPTAHRTLEQAREHNQTYGATKANMEKDKMGHRIRRKFIKEGKVREGGGMDIDHIKPVSQGGGHNEGNLRVVSASKNRGHGLSPGGRGKSKR